VAGADPVPILTGRLELQAAADLLTEVAAGHRTAGVVA